jgi:hypothetical protein
MSAGLVEKPSEGSALIVAHLESVAGKKRTAELLQAAIDRKLHDLDRKEMFRGRPFGESHLFTQTRARLRKGWHELTTGEKNTVAKSALNLFLESPPAPAAQTPAPRVTNISTMTTNALPAPTPAKASSGSKPTPPGGLELDALQVLHAAIFDGNGKATRETIEADFSREGLAEIVGLSPKPGLRAPQLWGRGASAAKEICADFVATLRGEQPSQQYSSGAHLARRYLQSKTPNRT